MILSSHTLLLLDQIQYYTLQQLLISLHLSLLSSIENDWMLFRQGNGSNTGYYCTKISSLSTYRQWIIVYISSLSATYISNVYSKLLASIKTKKWSTPYFFTERELKKTHCPLCHFYCSLTPLSNSVTNFQTAFSFEIPNPDLIQRGNTIYWSFHQFGVGPTAR